MQISWLGYSSFRIGSGGTNVLLNPVDPASGFKIHKQSANIVVSTVTDASVAKAVGGAPFIITEAGEYEVQSIFVSGFPSGDQTVYLLTIEDVRLAFIGPQKIKELSNKQLELLEGSDVMIVPVGGGAVAGVKDAVQMINQIEPRLVIPSYYKIKGSKGLDTVDAFLKEYSASSETVDKLRLAKRDLPQEDTKVAVIQYV